MQQKQKKSKLKNLCSKFKEWCGIHRIPVFLIPAAVLTVLALVTVCIGGLILGWNFKEALTSSTAVLLYVVAGTLAFSVLYYFIVRTHNRW